MWSCGQCAAWVGCGVGNRGDLRSYHAIVQSLILIQECVGHAFMAAEQACRCCGLHSAEIILWPWLSGMCAEPWSLFLPYVYIATHSGGVGVSASVAKVAAVLNRRRPVGSA